MEPTRSLDVTTLNVWGLPAPVARDNARRMRAIGRELGERAPDIACFQEVWTAEWRSALLAAGRAAGYTEHWHRVPAFGGSGLLVLSKWPLRQPRFTAYRWSAPPERIDQLDYFGRKGFARFEVETDFGVVTLANTHLQAAYDQDRNGYPEVRALQWLQLAAALAPVRTPLVVCGDLNIAAGTPEAELLTGLIGLRDSAVDADSAWPTTHTVSPYREPEKGDARIDYVLTRAGNGGELAPKEFEHCFNSPLQDGGSRARPSDHDGLCARFAWQSSRPDRSHAAAMEPGPKALALIERHLDRADRIAATRRRNRWLAGATSGAGALLAQRAQARQPTRRSLLRQLLALAGFAGLGGAGALMAFAEWQAASERAALLGARADLASLTA